MTKIDQGSNGSADSTSVEVSGIAKRRDQTPTLRLRISIGADDVGLLPLYNALLELPSDKARRLHVRQILLQSVTSVPVARHAPQAPIFSPAIVTPAAPQLNEITTGKDEPTNVGATPRAGKAEIFKKFDMLD